MPVIDFDQVEDAEDFSPLPPDDYFCRVSDVEETVSQNGNEMWNLTLTVMDGEFGGRKFFDRLVFTPAALKRVKFVVQKLGIDVSGTVELVPDMLTGRQAIVTVQNEPYTDDKGREKVRNSVPFAGYESVDGAGAPSPDDGPAPITDDDIPFLWALLAVGLGALTL